MSDEVWVVDEQRTALDALLAVLRGHGISARGFSDPRRALELAQREAPGVLIADQTMATLSGVELARELRARLTADCPRLLLVTGKDLRRVELTLFDHVVRKPFRLTDLVPKVRSYLAPRAARRARSHLTLRAAEPTRQVGGPKR